MVTQIHTPELYQDIVFDAHVNPLANIRGTKVREATVIERGTVRLANNLGTTPLTAVQASDSRLHLPCTDIGTISNSFIVNMDHVPGDNSTVVFNSSVANRGGGVRYNDTTGRMEFTYDFNGAQTWHEFASIEDLGNGIIYRTALHGHEADNAPINTIYSLTTGSFNIDGIKLLVFVNGQMKSHYAGDYVIVNTTSIQFTHPRSNTDTIEMLVYADIIFRTTMLGIQADDSIRTRYTFNGMSLSEDSHSVLIYVNGQLKCEHPPLGVQRDYRTLDDNTIEFTFPRQPTDIIEVIVAAIGTFKSSTGENDSDGTSAETFRIANTSNDLGDYKLLFGDGNTYTIGIRSYYGVMQYQNMGGEWQPIGSTGATGLPIGNNGYILISDDTEETGVKWVNPQETKLLPPGTNSYMLVADSSRPSGTRWTNVPLGGGGGGGTILPPGIDGYILMADSRTPTGFRWVLYPGGNPDAPDVVANGMVLVYDTRLTNNVGWSYMSDPVTPFADTSNIQATGTMLVGLTGGIDGYVLVTDSAAANLYNWSNALDCGAVTGLTPPATVRNFVGDTTLAYLQYAGIPDGFIYVYDSSFTNNARWTNTLDGGTY